MAFWTTAGTSDIPEYHRDVECLALNIYHESRNESTAGQVGVAQTTLNRVESKRFPNSVCGVVYQGMYRDGVPVRDGCQFSWFCDGLADTPRNMRAYERSYKLANIMMDTGNAIPDITDGSLYYHADYVSPRWSKTKIKRTRIDSHIFYR